MDSKEFKQFRSRLQKTQKQMARLLGTSTKAIHSYEQRWRSIPPHVERQVLFLVSRLNHNGKKQQKCWTMLKCPKKKKEKCPAWEFKLGQLCWFINGTICEGEPQSNWQEKMEMCRSCEVFNSHLC
ncbi:MAG: transcriptional regulator [Deltaproteobacteria bacterium]|nr:transcriptional regulator [Deltaproteobacteria bacterium]MBW2364666.1 transcriptional regulator [Deltaproteobacteria bacterium]